ncbi:hypothetical protein PTKIN_Ptkin11bG0179200 [Pterospermum kingtungense]
MFSISLVCRHWKLAAGAALFWKDYETLDLSPLQTHDLLSAYEYPRVDKCIYKALEFVLNSETMEHHGGCIRNVLFARWTYLKDSHLDFLAERSPKLKRLMLPQSLQLTLNGVSTIIQKWRELEELTIGPIEHQGSHIFVQTLGSSCKNLTRLHITGSTDMEHKLSGKFFMLDEKSASTIAENLPKLSVFSMDEAYLYKSGVLILLSETKNLVELNLKYCDCMADPETASRKGSSTLADNVVLESCCSRLKNSEKWSITLSTTDHSLIYTAQGLVNHLWKIYGLRS